MADCCIDKVCEIDTLRSRQSSMLKIVLGINAVMFVVELMAGIVADSVSLVADSLDMLGDALVYGFGIYVVARGARMKAVAALSKGGIMATFGLFVLGQAIYRMIIPHVPVFEAIGAIGLGTSGTTERMRVPKPPARMIACITRRRSPIVAARQVRT